MNNTIGIIGHENNEKTILFINKFKKNFLKDNNNYYELIKNEKLLADDINEIINLITVKTLNNKIVLIIYNFDQISELNQNKLLKIIENNPDTIMQIYVFNDINKVLKTIKSRLIIYDTNELDINFDFNFLNNIEINYLKNNEDILNLYKKFNIYINDLNFTNAFILIKKNINNYTIFDLKIIHQIILNMLFKNKCFNTFKKIEKISYLTEKINPNQFIILIFIYLFQSLEIKNLK